MIVKNVSLGWLFLLVNSSIMFSSISLARELSLETYLDQVSQAHDGIKASRIAIEASQNKKAESELIESPVFFMNAQQVYDQKYSNAPGRGSRLNASGLSFGVSKATDFGLSGKVTYSLSRTEMPLASPTMMPEKNYFDTSTTLELNQSLLKNGGGEDIKNQISLINSQAALNQNIEEMKMRVSRAEAEGNYWRLVLAREAVKFQKENLSRAQALTRWMSNKVAAKLADQSELMSAEAISDLRRIELQGGLDEEKAAVHAFNTARNSSETEVSETLTPITPQLIGRLSPPAGGVRPDVAAAIESLRLAEASGNLGKDKYKMTLDVFASLGLNGHDPEASKSISEGFSGKHPYKAVGVKINLPLGRSAIYEAREGYGKDIVVAELTANRKKFEADREWVELNRKFKEVKERLKLVEKLEEVQRKKLDIERAKQQRGRSVLFQVIQYESDLVTAQLNVVRTKGELLSLIARMKIFGETK